MISQVVVSEREGAQTNIVTARLGLQDCKREIRRQKKYLEKYSAEGERPVFEMVEVSEQYPEQRGTGEILCETASTIW